MTHTACYLDEGDRVSDDFDISSVRAPLVRFAEAVEEHLVTAAADGASSRRSQAVITSLDKLDSGLLVRTRDGLGRCVAHIVRRICEAVG